MAIKVLLLAKQTQAHAQRTCGAGIKVTHKYTKKTKCCQQPLLAVADVHGVEVHDIQTLKFAYFRIIFRFLLHITIVYPKWRNLLTKIPANQWQAIDHKLFEAQCY